jgi:antitoxin component HigA of HigAB toxin-antitoxin module
MVIIQKPKIMKNKKKFKENLKFNKLKLKDLIKLIGKKSNVSNIIS